MTDTLTDRQERFVYEYLIDQNASAAAKRCGYSAKSAAWQGSALMRIPEIRDRIRIELQSLMAEVKLTLLDLVKERLRAAYFRNGRMFGPDGKLLAVEAMPRDMLELLDISVTWRQGEPILRLKQPSRDRALSALEKLLERRERADEKRAEQAERERRAERAPPQVRPPIRVPDILWRDASELEQAEVGVEIDPGSAEKHVDSCGPANGNAEKHGGLPGPASPPVRAEPSRSAREQPSGTRVSTGSTRTEVRREISEKHGDLSGSGSTNPEKHRVLSGAEAAAPAGPAITEEGLQACREKLARLGQAQLAYDQRARGQAGKGLGARLKARFRKQGRMQEAG